MEPVLIIAGDIAIWGGYNALDRSRWESTKADSTMHDGNF
jgi:hypothetical protein